MPAAMASTFFKAPDISTPTTSVEVLTRRQLEANRRCTRRASSGSSDAATMAVGSPAVTQGLSHLGHWYISSHTWYK